MTRGGFEEAQAKFAHADAGAFVGQVRRFGAQGPAYEVIGISPGGSAVDIQVIQSGETLSYSVTDLLADPLATTIP